jgi:hypothetical protein
MTVVATTMSVKTVMACIGNGVGGDYNSDSGVGNSDSDNNGSSNS